MKKYKKIIHIIGTRPQYVKLFKHPNQVVINTGQHYDKKMTKVFLTKDKPSVKYNLGCTTIGMMIDALPAILKTEKPDYVIIYGDCNSTLAGAIAAKQCNIPIIHIEAGLRCHDMSIPEEWIRVIVDKLSLIHLAPTETAMNNLEREGLGFSALRCGSSMTDAVLQECPTKEVKGYEKNTYRVLTLHRAELVDNKERLEEVLSAIKESGESFVWPLNPRTKKNIEKFKIKLPDNIKIIEPLDHKTMVHLMAFAKQICVDSGGIQVEAYFLRKPVIIIRQETEWKEIIEEGWGVLTGYNKEKIIDAIKNHLPSPFRHNTGAFGAGDTNIRIANYLKTL